MTCSLMLCHQYCQHSIKSHPWRYDRLLNTVKLKCDGLNKRKKRKKKKVETLVFIHFAYQHAMRAFSQFNLHGSILAVPHINDDCWSALLRELQLHHRHSKSILPTRRQQHHFKAQQPFSLLSCSSCVVLWKQVVQDEHMKGKGWTKISWSRPAWGLRFLIHVWHENELLQWNN